MSSFSQWQANNQYPGGDAPFRAAETAGPEPVFRDALDARRSMYKRTPEASYPSGYLGTIETKRRERLRGEDLGRANNKSFVRGVHVGEHSKDEDYFWPEQFNLTSALEYEAAGMRFVPPGALMDVGLMPTLQPDPNQVAFARVGPRGTPGRVGTEEFGVVDQDRAATLKRLAPPWSSGGPGQMSLPYPGRA